MVSPHLEASPQGSGILHTVSVGSEFDHLAFRKLSESRVPINGGHISNTYPHHQLSLGTDTRGDSLNFQGREVVYNTNEFPWQLFPNPKFSGESDGEITAGDPGNPTETDTSIKLFRRGNNFGTIRKTASGVENIQSGEYRT